MKNRAPVTVCEIEFYEKFIDKHGVQGALRVYSKLMSKGFEYAYWAKGVAAGSTTTGVAALSFMTNKYEKDNPNQKLTETDIDEIRVDMIKGYLQALRKNIEEGNKISTTKDINYKQAREFHEKAFVENGLSIKNWTLEAPMNLIAQLYGEEAKEEKWQELMETKGTYFDSIWDSNKLRLMVDNFVTDINDNGFYYVNEKTGEYVPNYLIKHSYNTGHFKFEKRYLKDEELFKSLAEWKDIVGGITNGIIAMASTNDILDIEDYTLYIPDLILCIKNDIPLTLYKAECFVCPEERQPWFFDTITKNTLPQIPESNLAASMSMMSMARSLSARTVNTRAEDSVFVDDSDTCTTCNPLELDLEIAKLPNISAFGTVVSLHDAMKKNLVLKEMVENYLKLDSDHNHEKLNEVIYLWTNSFHIDKNSRGSVDARKLVSMENLIGRKYKKSNNNLRVKYSEEGDLVHAEFDQFARYVKANFMLYKTEYQSLYDHILKVMGQTDEKPQWTEFFDHLKSLHEQGNIQQARDSYFIVNNLLTYSRKYKNSLDFYLFNNLEKYLEWFEKGIHIEPMTSSSNLNNIIINIDNKRMHGHDGHDYLSGSDIDNEIQGGDGIDVLNGGKGHDKLRGGDKEGDYYVFTEGHGYDIVFDTYNIEDNQNHFVFLLANSKDAKFIRLDNHLVIQAYQNENDKVVFYQFFEKQNNKYIEFRFSNEILNGEHLKTLPLHDIHGTEQGDMLQAWIASSKLYGYAGDDDLWGNLEVDYLDGGTGNDKLRGGKGADVYLFSKGYGKDLIYDGSYYFNQNPDEEPNKIVFLDAYSQDMKLVKIKDDLVIYPYADNTEDSVTIVNYYLGNWQTASKFYELQFTDRTIHSRELESTRVFVFAKDNQSSISYDLEGSWFDDEIYGSNEFEYIYGRDGHDIIFSGKGRDTIRGDSGNDIFVLDDLESYDIIEDFLYVQDKIRLDKNVFTVFKEDTIRVRNLHYGESAQEPEQYLIFNPQNNQLFYDVDGNGNEAPIHIATINGFFPEKHLSYYHFEIL